MKRDPDDALASEFETHRIVRQLHDVPPHEVYEVYVNGQYAVYKGDTDSTGSAATEGLVTALVDEQTSVPVPEVLFVGDSYYVATWHSDAPTPTEDGEPDETWAFAAGRGIATLHNETDQLIHEYGQFRPRNDDVAITGYNDWQAAALAYIRRYRLIPDRYGYGDIVDSVLDFLTDRSDLFEGVGSPVCCHGWATPEHVSVLDGRVGCMLDFEHAIAAPGEFDYWRTVMPTFTHNTDCLEQAFRNGYESVRSLPVGFERRKPLYVLLNLIYYFESLYVQDQHGPEEAAERADGLRNGLSELLDQFS